MYLCAYGRSMPHLARIHVGSGDQLGADPEPVHDRCAPWRRRGAAAASPRDDREQVPVCTRTLQTHGVQVDVEAVPPKMGPLVAALTTALAALEGDHPGAHD